VTRLAANLLRTVSIVLCMIAALSFLLFALNQTSTASGRQQESLSESAPPKHGSASGSTQKGESESGFRKTVDEITEAAASPVSGLSSSQWAERALRLIFALLVFGFGFGYLARLLRVRS